MPEFDDFEKFLNDILNKNPELGNFNLDFLKNINPDELEDIIEKLKEASAKFKEADDKITEKVLKKLNFEIKDLKINFDTYLNTIATFPFALAIGEEALENNHDSGVLKGNFFGKKVEFSYNNVFEMVSIKKAVAMEISKLIRKNFLLFLNFKDELNQYITEKVNTYIRLYNLEDFIEVTDIKEFNMVVRVKSKKYNTFKELMDQDMELFEKVNFFKAYLITEFSIAIIE
ncbi:hypothetical protein OSSY52_21940 [Tepiditoga spiralis]|uniref:Uncharacterized protein n=1 Tax=Tepiditoga spiralis TaxID=2108365 RepID=A0A7G1GAC3_9BACT|nr:hypothetical protein [Tepiditoga spiralis]BBE32053.1 hypothetical protein OSSY52_21940 [Tepiditoga spiralis]